MKQNVLVILCDQLRKDCLGCYGNRSVRTPHIDALAGASVRCDRNYVANPICMPNRLSLFSGMYPRNHGLWTNGLLIRDEGCTLMHHLRENGYQTAGIGKLHFEPNACGAESGSRESYEWFARDPDAQAFHGPFWGFDYVEVMDAHYGVSGHMSEWFAAHGGKPEMFSHEHCVLENETGWNDVPKTLHPSAFVGERTCHYLRSLRDRDKPFFALASFPDPHHPFNSPKECYEAVKDRALPAPCGSPEDLQTRPERYRQMYEGSWNRKGLQPPAHPDGIPAQIARERTLHTYAMIELIDEYVGRILETLKAEGLWDNTVIVFTSDHGDLLGDFGLWKKGPFFFEGLVSTPLLVRVPGQAGGICDRLISAVDLAPTLCDIIGEPTPYYMDGVSQQAALRGCGTGLREQCLIEYRNGYGENDVCHRVLVTQRYKYAVCQTGEEELTDLRTDPQELRSVAAEPAYEPVKRELQRQLLLEMLKTESKKPRQICLA